MRTLPKASCKAPTASPRRGRGMLGEGAELAPRSVGKEDIRKPKK